MTHLWNDPADFADEMIAGFVAANGHHVRRVEGGVVRRSTTPAGQVAVVVGGGSGHYPAFGGLVGPGLAHGAAMGNLFASPSTQQIISVARAAEGGAGVLFSYGNYAGDALNFDAAQEQLRQDGVPCETVRVTDDIASAGPADRPLRRGIAGDLTVFRSAAGAAEAGYRLSDVKRIAELANDRTRSFGVAFSGCTLPGADAPLFDVEDERMAIGLGIHGEPGIGEEDVPSADKLAELMVSRLLEEVPDGVTLEGAHVVPILNGLGSVKYEELFVVYRRVAELLSEAGAQIVDPHVGEFCTSFDMAGASLTLFWPDAELEQLWQRPVATPAYARDGFFAAATSGAVDVEALHEVAASASDSTSRAVGGVIAALLAAVHSELEEHEEELGRLDAVAGDGDHGIGMVRGATAATSAAADAVREGAGAATVLRRAADAWSGRAGGTSGALWGVMLSSAAGHLDDEGSPSAEQVAAGVSSAVENVMRHGGASVGDKTIVDALVPFGETFGNAVRTGSGVAEAWREAATAACEAAERTADLLPRIGRARPHAERSLGTPDPGAHSFALIARAVAASFDEQLMEKVEQA
jgi:dihydroxyacetone kinase